jgi:dCTP deaminase
MSAMSDNWIIKQCTKPTHRMKYNRGVYEKLIAPPFNKVEANAVKNWCTIKAMDVYSNMDYAVPLEADELPDWVPMIVPFRAVSEKVVNNAKIISRGVSSYGYDVTLSGQDLKLFTNLNSAEIDPRNMTDKCFVDPVVREDVNDGAKYVLLPPNSYLLGFTEEYFRIPNDILVICVGKSTYARAGVAVNVTPIEPGFVGNVVIEIANQTNLPVRVYLDQGIAQFVFFKGDEPCMVSYADRGGKYMGQTGIVHAKV